MPDKSGLLSARVLPTPAVRVDESDEVSALEARWWLLRPGEVGYNTPIWAYCGMTEEQWEQRRSERGAW